MTDGLPSQRPVATVDTGVQELYQKDLFEYNRKTFYLIDQV